MKVLDFGPFRASYVREFDLSHSNQVNRIIKITHTCTGGEETRSGTEKGCSHNLQSGHPAWWSADNCIIFPTVNDLDFLEARSELAEEIRNA